MVHIICYSTMLNPISVQREITHFVKKIFKSSYMTFWIFLGMGESRRDGDIPLVRQPLFRQPISPTAHYSDSPLL